MDVLATSATDKSLLLSEKQKITLFAFCVLQKSGSFFP
jgi:hypothetical protein